MTTNGILEHIDGRKLQLNCGRDQILPVYLRKGVDANQYLPLLQSEVEVITVNEKGYEMVQEIKPALPKTEVEKVKGPIDMPPSANVPVLNFGESQKTFTTSQHPMVEIKYRPDTKQKVITASWAMGAVLNSHALASTNDAMALSTQQTMERAKKLAGELIAWVEEQAIK